MFKIAQPAREFIIGPSSIESVQDLSFSVPGLTMREDGPGSYTIFLRGLANQSGNGALVGQYLDEAPLTLDGYNQLSPVALGRLRVFHVLSDQGARATAHRFIRD